METVPGIQSRGQEEECLGGENCDLPPEEKARNSSGKGDKGLYVTFQ